MPHLMHVALDNPFRLRHRVGYFRYSDVRFKLIQNNPRQWSDVLLTITEASSGPEVAAALAAAGEFASALCWEFDVGLSVRHLGSVGKRNGFRLRSARCQMHAFPELPFRGMHVGYSLAHIANIETDAQRKALALYREAQSANKEWLTILLNWQVLEVDGKAVAFVDRIARRHTGMLARVRDDMNKLGVPLGNLGAYLQDEFRHAIAHVKRDAGKRALRFDNDEEAARIARGSRIIRELARIYIRQELHLTSQKFLVRRRGREFPSYEDRQTIESDWYAAVR